MRRAVLLALAMAGWAAQAPAQGLEAVPRPIARDQGEVLTARPALRPFFVLVTGARATGQSLAPQPAAPLLPLPLTSTQTHGPLMPEWPGLGPQGIVPGPLAILSPVPVPTGRLAAQEARARTGAGVSVDVARLGRLFAANRSQPLRITRPQVIVPDEALLSQATQDQPMARPDLRPLPRPGSVTAAPEAPTGTRPQARPDRPTRAQVVPLGPAAAGPFAAFAPGTLSPLATAVAYRPPQRPEGIADAYQVARAQRAGGSVCRNPAIQGRVIDPVGSGGCRVANPVQITSVSGVALSTAAIMDCPTAQALNAWVEQGARPAVGGTGGGIASLRVAAHYACRTRNNVPGARLSEHASGRAIDISGILLNNGSEISVLRDWGGGAAGQALSRMHGSACGIFGTVLGPNADAAHRSHFHFDTARHRNGSYCR